MAGFRRDKPIDPMHEAGICRWLAEHHERRVAETEGWEKDDHAKAAKACRERAEEWEAKAAAKAAPPARRPGASAFPTKVAASAPAPKPKTTKPVPPQPAKADGDQGALF